MYKFFYFGLIPEEKKNGKKFLKFSAFPRKNFFIKRRMRTLKKKKM